MKGKKVKKISLILSLIMIISLIGFNKSVVADIPSKPSFDLDMTATPNPAMIGEDITVNGKIKPQPFETEIPAKEIVLVLDTSGSMEEEINELCELPRGRYCISHSSHESNHEGRRHDWKDDYCSVHEKTGAHTYKKKKIDALKEAAKDFIETMKNVENLKIAILQYSSLATINPNNTNGNETYYAIDRNPSSLTVTKYNSAGENFINASSSNLLTMIDNLKADGGTNIGEGLRKAIYILDKEESNASKSIVLMTDGAPTFYSAKKINKTYEQWKNDWKTTGRNKDSWTSGISEEKVKAAFDNWCSYMDLKTNFTYDNWKAQWNGWVLLTSEEKAKIKSAFDDYKEYNNSNVYEEYYDINNNPIKYVGGNGSSINDKSLNYAKYIGNLIKEKGYNSYSIGYGMNTEGNNALKSIHSSMTGNQLSDDKTKNEEKGYYQTSDNIGGIFNNIATEILNSYPVNNLALNITFQDGFTLNIGGNKVDIGNITYTKVEGASSTNKVKYEAKEVPFSFIVKASKVGQQTINSKINISYVFNNEPLSNDVNKPISINVESNELPKIGASLVSEKSVSITKEEEFKVKYKLSPEDFEFNDVNNATEKDVILLIDNSSLVNDNAFNSLKNSMFNKLLNNTTLRNSKTNYSVITFSDQAKSLAGFTDNITQLNDNVIKNINKTSSSVADLNKTVDLIKETFSKGRASASKNIIIIAQDNVNYSSEKIDELESKGYNIIILSLGNGQSSNLLKLKDNKDLLIENESVFITGNDGNNVENNIMGKVAERLISSTKYKPYIFNPEININLLGNFEVLEGATMINETTAKLLSDKKVVYNNIGNNMYHAEPIEIEFTVKVKAENPGSYIFGSATLKHENLIGGYKEIVLETPKVTVKEEVKDLVHGLYSGLSGNEVIIDKASGEKGFEIIGASTVTFGAKFKTSSDKVKATLNIDSKFDLSYAEFEVYKVGKSEGKTILIKLEQLNNKINTNSLDIEIGNIGTNGIETELVVVYKAKVKENSVNELFENKITIGKLNESTSIYTPASPIHNEEDSMDKLPNLF